MMNQKRKIFPNTPMPVKGKTKKVRPKMKDTTKILKENKERPPTRRNPIENLGTEKVQGTKTKPHANKFKTSALAPTSREKSTMNIEQHEYLQFSLHITEEIIRNDLFKNDEMLHVLKQHYQANKGKLNKDKLLKTIVELCMELNIPMDETVLQLLEEPRVCVAPHNNGYSPVKSPNTDPNMGQTQNGTNENSYLSIYEEKMNINQQLPDEKQLQFAQPYSVVATTVPESTSNVLELQPIINEEDSDDVLKDKRAFETDFFEEVDKLDNRDKKDDSSKKIIEMELPDQCQFEFSEETLKAPGEDSIPLISSMQSKAKEFGDFHVLHDATAKFGDSERDSDASIAHKLTPVSTAESIISTQQIFVMNFDNLPKKPEKNLVVVHYATSVEPEQVQTKEFSVQAALDSNFENADKFNHYDVSTQKNVAEYCDAEVKYYAEPDRNGAINKNPQIILNSDVDSNACTRCNCDRGNKIEHEHGLIRISEDSNAQSGTCLSSNETQYVILDCPVLIPREHTKSMDFLNSIATRGCGFEKSFHTLNLRMPPNNFFANNSTSNLNSSTTATGFNGFNNAHSVSSNLILEENSSQNNDYDLTPQKDMYQSKQKPPHIPSYTSSPVLNNQSYNCCSCISASVNPSKLMTDKYDLKDLSRKSNALDRLNRYRKVNENLSYFYPTIATQVSSMDLISTDLDVYHNQQSRLYQSRRAYHEQRSSPTYQQQPYNEAPVADRLNKGDHRHDYSSSSESPREYNAQLDSPGVVSHFSNLIKHNKNVGNNERLKINLDNYRIESRPHENQKKIYEEATVDQDVDKGKQEKSSSLVASRGQTPTKSTHRAPDAFQLNLSRESVDDIGTHRSLGRYQSNDSMEIRIKTLRHDIEKYSKDDITTKRTTGTTRIESPKLLIEGIKQSNLNGVILPSEVGLPRHKRMSILRKQSINN